MVVTINVVFFLLCAEKPKSEALTLPYLRD